MIETFFGSGQLAAPAAFLAALVIGMAFGFVLERAGFGSSRRLAGIFYFRDMAVLKVMFTAVITAMLGLSYALALGWIEWSQLYAMPTIYGAQVIGGLLFGVGFVLSGWCPGTGAVGVASGKIDALVFLVGAVLGSIAFNETYGLIRPLTTWGAAEEPLFAFGMARPAFALLFTLVAIAAFYLAEWVEKRQTGSSRYLHSPFLKAFSLALVVFAVALFILPTGGTAREVAGAGVVAAPITTTTARPSEQTMLEAIEAAEDHFEPEELADRLLQGQSDLVVVDIRPASEYERFHIKGAMNVPMAELLTQLEPYKNRGLIVLYSGGMTHPAQARDTLARSGYQNAYLLTDGLQGFLDRCLKPVSLRDEPLPPEQAEQIRAWRAFFLGEANTSTTQEQSLPAPGRLPGLIETDWLAAHLGKPGLKLIDVRPQPEYNTSHIPGALSLNVESFRGIVDGVPSMLLPADLLVSHLSLMGIEPTDLVVLVPGDAVRDTTLLGMGLSRAGHQRWAVLDGGFAQWTAEKRPVDHKLPSVTRSVYPVPSGPDGFSVDSATILRAVGDGRTVILDVRPADYFSGKKSDEARAGHIPGAVNRPFKDDLDQGGQLKRRSELADAYRSLIPSPETPILVHCRTGHQASQTYFVLKHLLGYTNVRWYDGGWTQWAAQPELPVVDADARGQ